MIGIIIRFLVCGKIGQIVVLGLGACVRKNGVVSATIVVDTTDVLIDYGHHKAALRPIF